MICWFMAVCSLLCCAISIQAAKCSYTLSPASITFGFGQTNGTISVTANCQWTGASTNSWIQPAGSGTDNGTIVYSVDPNPTYATRTGSITAGDQTFLVTQRGLPMNLSAGLGNTNLVWVTSPDYPWSGTNPPAPSFSGVASAASGNRGVGNSTSWVQTTVVGPGYVSFWWKVDSDVYPPPPSEPITFDFLEFQINGIIQAQIKGQIDWRFGSFEVPAGTNTLYWQYVKDEAYNSGYDQGWLDSVSFTTNQPVPLYEALNTCGLDWTSGGNNNVTYWSGQTELSKDGASAARSGPISIGQESWLEASVSGVTNLSFWWKVSSRTNSDYLEFYTNSTLVRRITGEIDWQASNFKLSTGSHVLKWRLVRSTLVGNSSAQNCGWLDQVSVSPPLPPTILYYTTNLTLAADPSTCQAVLPDLTGPSDLVLSDNCGSVQIVQSPAPHALLPLGVTGVHITIAAPASGLLVITNNVLVADITSPGIVLLGSDPAVAECGMPFTDPGAVAADSCSGLLSFNTNSAVAVGQPGQYTISYTAVDQAGNSNTMNRTVYVRNTVPPVVTLIGSDPIQVECHGSFVDPGATAIDTCAGIVPVTTFGIVDPNTPGTYLVTYVATDGANSTSISRTVRVVDTTPPQVLSSFGTLTLDTGATNCTCLLPDLTGPAYVAAADACGTVNITQAPVPGTPLALGTNAIVFTVSDASGNSVAVTNQVVVKDTTGPVITVLGAEPAFTECSQPYADPGAIAFDNCSGVVSLTTNTTINPNEAGAYEITYAATDTAGNSSTNARTVYVRDTVAPVVTLIGNDLIQAECHGSFVDPGATAIDSCAGIVPVTTFGIVDPNTPGTYLLTYTASDGQNSNSVSRTVRVVDTIPPQVTWNIGDLVITGDVKTCRAILPDPTSPGFLTATDTCGSVSLTQAPPPGSTLPLGTNEVLLRAADSSGNVVEVTNHVFILEPAPVASLQPQDGTQRLGETVEMAFAVEGCSTVQWQWYFQQQPLAEATAATLLLTNIGSCHAGQYFATATSASGSVTSRVAVLTIINSPQTISPGGALAIGIANECDHLVLATNSSYTWEIADALSGPGVGWDALTVSGPIWVQATTDNPFRLRIVSLPAGNGVLSDFDPSINYAWTIAAASGPVVGFDPAAFSIETTDFSVPFNGAFSVGTNSSGMTVNYAGHLVAPQILAGTAQSNGFQLTFLGPRGQPFRILTTPDLSTSMEGWQVLTQSRFATGTNVFTDSLQSLPQRFYRVVSP